MDTKFVKVKPEERTTDIMFSNYKGITYWIKEVPDNTNQLMELLEECKVQLEYLNNDKEHGTTNNLLSRLETILK